MNQSTLGPTYDVASGGVVMRWRFAGAVVVVACLAACGPDSLSGLGGSSSGWIGAVATTQATTTTIVASTVRDAGTLNWVNDELAEIEGAEGQSAILSGAVARQAESSSFVQARRDEIAAVLPEIGFPVVVPATAAFVTSQLVVENQGRELSSDPAVAFGLWAVEPYTRSRSIGQVSVLQVSLDAAGAAATAEAGYDCTVYSVSRSALCALETISGIQYVRLESNTGLTHLWYSGDIRYELFVRIDVDEDIHHQMLESFAPLSGLTVTAAR